MATTNYRWLPGENKVGHDDYECYAQLFKHTYRFSSCVINGNQGSLACVFGGAFFEPNHLHLRVPCPQASRDPLAPELMTEIFEDVKDMGVLIGKGGNYGQVTIHKAGTTLHEVSHRCFQAVLLDGSTPSGSRGQILVTPGESIIHSPRRRLHPKMAAVCSFTIILTPLYL